MIDFVRGFRRGDDESKFLERDVQKVIGVLANEWNRRKPAPNFIERGLSPADVRRRNREQVASGNRSWSVTARPGNQGAYERPVVWTMTAADIVEGGAEAYCANVRAWARAVYEALA